VTDLEKGPQKGSVKNPPQPAYGASPDEAEATQLMGRVRGGEDEAFDELVRRLRDRAFHVARALVGSREDAMELTQEAFLKVYRARATYREGDPFLPWFHRILRNTCYSFLRKTGRLKKRSLSGGGPGRDEDEADWELADDAPAPDAGLLADERARAFWRAFRRLSGRDREILGLRHFDEMAYKEIARALEIPEGTVMSRLFHARRRLRDELAELLPEDADAGGPR
jgi:RNA polymerase sigma-70 factor, ECF subfamily